MTFSLVARCAQTGMFGVAICSSSPAVAARCSFVRAGVGAVASQNITDPSLGTRALDLLESGASSIEVVDAIKTTAPHIEYRQLLVVDQQGKSAIHSGLNALGIWSEANAENVASGGNLLADESVPQVIVEAYLSSSGHIADRLIDALRAGLLAGGEAGPVHSAGIKVVDKVTWPVIDLRCDWSDACPIETVAQCWKIYEPQVQDYVQRALDPREAPSYGVPGDD